MVINCESQPASMSLTPERICIMSSNYAPSVPFLFAGLGYTISQMAFHMEKNLSSY